MMFFRLPAFFFSLSRCNSALSVIKASDTTSQEREDYMKNVLKYVMVVLVLVSSTSLLFACKSSSDSGASASPGVVRTYFIAADEVNWDYAPLGNNIDPAFDPEADVFLTNTPFDPTGLVTGGTPTLTLARI